MAVRLEAIDEYMHALGPEPTFNESMYFNLYDSSHRLGGWFRLGNRANEGHAEMTVCLYLPDGRVGFMFRRATIADNSAFAAGGLRFEVIEPFEALTATYEGTVVLLDEPKAMADPKRAFTENPHADCAIALDYRRVSAMFGGEPDEHHERPGEEFAKGHYEQLVTSSGTVRVGDEEWAVAGAGLRDHSWGPRTWQAPWYYRWLTANGHPDVDGRAEDGAWGFMLSRIARADGPGTRGGFVWEDGALHLCQHAEITTAWTGADSYHDEVALGLRSGDREWRGTGRVLNLIPLRNRREGRVTRISEGLTEWTLDDGRVGYGLSEYLDQIIDGQPVGLDE
ncbi:MAG: hypothetical protein WKF43_04765 [Acidimicrobiales bacterium]